MNIPYNNGKVSIGSNYDANPLKRKYIESDVDMIHLQTALVGNVKEYRKTRLLNILYMVLIGLILMLAYGLANAQAVYGSQGQYLGYMAVTPNGVSTYFTPAGQAVQSSQVDNGQTNFYSPQGVYQGTSTVPTYRAPNVTYTVPREVPQVRSLGGW